MGQTFYQKLQQILSLGMLYDEFHQVSYERHVYEPATILFICAQSNNSFHMCPKPKVFFTIISTIFYQPCLSFHFICILLGFNASYAFDNNDQTSWYASGWGTHDNNDDWIAYEFQVAVRIHAVRMILDETHRTASPKKVFVEASDKKFGPFNTKWTLHNLDYSTDKVYKFVGKCD